jgi:hypothetical protein
VEDPASTPALDYSWSASTSYSLLLTILNIDTRIVVRTSEILIQYRYYPFFKFHHSIIGSYNNQAERSWSCPTLNVKLLVLATSIFSNLNSASIVQVSVPDPELKNVLILYKTSWNRNIGTGTIVFQLTMQKLEKVPV